MSSISEVLGGSGARMRVSQYDLDVVNKRVLYFVVVMALRRRVGGSPSRTLAVPSCRHGGSGRAVYISKPNRQVLQVLT
ncbi:hypothetical protein EWB00_004487 [Schistosoma japonicum]|uniref:Uncharacterized protein n=1 Tax=Schistosoma japonicum TaxID=6182 RepID=A0A4Z2D4Y6_SCHJA|nr:hypothetical protein KSF78_0008679 [Schistosoma japonicum]TNN11541.1 hypothetical protein EWB00_004487 [Schistosoma japonicum]